MIYTGHIVLLKWVERIIVKLWQYFEKDKKYILNFCDDQFFLRMQSGLCPCPVFIYFVTAADATVWSSVRLLGT